MTVHKKSIFASVLLITMLFGTAACREVVIETVPSESTANANGETSAANSGTSLKGSLVLTGSTSMADVATALAEAFMAANTDVTVSVGGNGSGEGPTAVKDGTAQIGMLSRELKDSESPAQFDIHIIGYDGIAVIVNPSSGVTDLSSAQVAGIFTGAITNWKEVGGADRKIQCIGREAASGTRGAFEELLGIADKAVYKEEQNSTGNVKQAVAANPDAIGYVSISAVDSSVTAVKLDGVQPTEEDVRTGAYTLQRPFVMITGAGSTDSLSTAFIDFIYSEQGMKIVADDGIVPNTVKS
jgi:phosphate transport system substrate-binding protein